MYVGLPKLKWRNYMRKGVMLSTCTSLKFLWSHPLGKSKTLGTLNTHVSTKYFPKTPPHTHFLIRPCRGWDKWPQWGGPPFMRKNIKRYKQIHGDSKMAMNLAQHKKWVTNLNHFHQWHQRLIERKALALWRLGWCAHFYIVCLQGLEDVWQDSLKWTSFCRLVVEN